MLWMLWSVAASRDVADNVEQPAGALDLCHIVHALHEREPGAGGGRRLGRGESSRRLRFVRPVCSASCCAPVT
jgi:hypothetical protein